MLSLVGLSENSGGLKTGRFNGSTFLSYHLFLLLGRLTYQLFLISSDPRKILTNLLYYIMWVVQYDVRLEEWLDAIPVDIKAKVLRIIDSACHVRSP